MKSQEPLSVNSDSPQFEIHRLKARIHVTDGSIKMIQGVREVFEITDSIEALARHNTQVSAEKPTQSASGSAPGKMVLIGRDLPGKPWQESLLEGLAD
jgi:hypothetical protein